MLLTFLFTLAGGLTRVGLPLLQMYFKYIENKQDIKKLELSKDSNNTESIQSCNFQCKYQITTPIKSKSSNQDIEKKQPKRFTLIVFILIVCFIGVCTDLFLTINYYGDLIIVQQKLDLLSSVCYGLISYITTWTLTGSAINFIKK